MKIRDHWTYPIKLGIGIFLEQYYDPKLKMNDFYNRL